MAMVMMVCHANKVQKDSPKSFQLCVRSMRAVSGKRHMGGQSLSQTAIGRRWSHVLPPISPSHHVLPPTILYPFTTILCQINRSSLTFLIIRFMSCSTTPRRTLPQESGRLQYFGFSSMDCGIVIRDIGTRDSGGWTCRVSATGAGKHQVSADIVRLFVGENSFSL